MKIALVQGDEWQGLYLDGKLVLENHSLSARHVLEKLRDHSDDIQELSCLIVDEEWLDGQGSLPERLSDVEVSQ